MTTNNYTPPDKPLPALPLNVDACRTALVRAMETGKVDIQHVEDIPQAERDRLAGLGVTTGCWTWTAAKNSNGYGTVKVAGRTRQAHRVALVAKTGQDIPPGLTLDHLCSNRACVSPAHLEVVSTRENSRRGVNAANAGREPGAPPLCSRGHLITGLNMRTAPSKVARGWTECRACNSATSAASKRRSRGWEPTEAEYDAFVRDYAADRYAAFIAGIDLVDPGMDPDGQLRWTW